MTTSLLIAGAIIAGTGAYAIASAPAADHLPKPRRAQVTATTTSDTRLTYLALTSSRRGFGFFQTFAGSRCDAASGRTTDGGAIFTQRLAITSWNCGNNAPISALAADGEGDLFAYGPRLFYLGKGSGKWLARREPGAVLGIAAFGKASVWMLLGQCEKTTCRLVLLESVTGGRSWHGARSQPRGAMVRAMPGNLPSAEPAAGQTWLVRTGALTGYVVTSPTVNDRGKPDMLPLWYTDNSGATWSSRRQLPCGIDALTGVVAAAPGGALAAVCAGQPGAGSQLKSAATSANGGRTWVVHTVPCPRHQSACDNPLLFGYLGEIQAASARKIFLVGSRSSLLVTSDGGARWAVIRPLVGDDSGGTQQVIFFGKSIGVVLGDDGANNDLPAIWHTANGGKTWSKVSPTLR